MNRLSITAIGLTLTVIITGSFESGSIGAESKLPPIKACQATTPAKNPWTKRLPKGWWLQRHQDTLTLPNRSKTQIAFIGDSITDGWDADKNGLNVWKRQFVPMNALNLGINCDSTQHVLWRLDHGAVDKLPNLKVAVVMIGVNNKGINRHKDEDVAAGIIAVCQKLREKAPQAKILLMGVFPRMFGKDMSPDINNTIAKLHDGKQIFYLNINEQLVQTKGAIADRVGHLKEKGYEIWAAQIMPTVKKLRQEKP